MEPIILVVCAIFCAILILKVKSRADGFKSIPGPKFRFPIFGHLLLLGREPWITFMQWTKLYGPMFAIKMGIYDVVVLNESKLIKEAFSRPEFSGRPSFELFQSVTEGKGIIFNDGALVAEQRSFAHKSLRGFGLRTNLLAESTNLELNQVLEDMEKKCGKPVAIRRTFAVPTMNAIWNIFMGHRFDHDDPQLRRISQAVGNFVKDDGPLASLSYFIPAISKFIPEFSGYNAKREGFLVGYGLVKRAFDEPLPPTRTPGDPQNFKEAFIDEMERVGDNQASSFHPTREFFQYSAGDIFLASIESISTTLDWLMLCMAKHPEAQKKVQAEVDEKIGTGRRPALLDKDNTPYVEAVIQEVFRFSTIGPLALFHRTTEDTEIGGYNIKKDTLVVSNAYGVHYDPDVWGDPENFRPERFIDAIGTVDRNLMRALLAFGTGKRSCIGETLAREQIYLYCTSIFQRFNVSCDDEDTAIETTVGLGRTPKDFQLTFTKRFTD